MLKERFEKAYKKIRREEIVMIIFCAIIMVMVRLNGSFGYWATILLTICILLSVNRILDIRNKMKHRWYLIEARKAMEFADRTTGKNQKKDNFLGFMLILFSLGIIITLRNYFDFHSIEGVVAGTTIMLSAPFLLICRAMWQQRKNKF